MTSPRSPWARAELGPTPPNAPTYAAGAPLGGQPSVEQPVVARSDRRELVLAGVLFLAALIAGAATLMPWRDFGQRFGGTVDATGWTSADGSLARGWIVVLLAILLAVAGILIASGRVGRGRVLASGAGAGLVLAAVVEWGLGVGSVRSGPGLGLWVVFVTGIAVVVAVGALDSRPRADS